MSATNLKEQSQTKSPRAYRRRVLQGAHAAFNNEYSSIPCRVKNISETGALLEFTDPDSIPSKFVLHVELEGFKIDCTRVRRIKNQVAVQFCGKKQKTHLSKTQCVGVSQKRPPSREAKENELKDMLEQQRHESLRKLHNPSRQISGRKHPETPASVVFGKRS